LGAFYAFGLHEYFAFESVRANVGELKGQVDDNFFSPCSSSSCSTP